MPFCDPEGDCCAGNDGYHEIVWKSDETAIEEALLAQHFGTIVELQQAEDGAETNEGMIIAVDVGKASEDRKLHQQDMGKGIDDDDARESRIWFKVLYFGVSDKSNVHCESVWRKKEKLLWRRRPPVDRNKFWGKVKACLEHNRQGFSGEPLTHVETQAVKCRLGVRLACLQEHGEPDFEEGAHWLSLGESLHALNREKSVTREGTGWPSVHRLLTH